VAVTVPVLILEAAPMIPKVMVEGLVVFKEIPPVPVVRSALPAPRSIPLVEVVFVPVIVMLPLTVETPDPEPDIKTP